MDSPDPPGRTIRVSTSGLSNAEAIDFRHSMTEGTYRLHIGNHREHKSSLEGIAFAAGGHIISDLDASSAVRSRDPASLRKDSRRYVKIRQYVSGSGCTVVTGERSFKLGAGDIHVMDQSCEFTEVCHGGRQYNFLIAHDEIGFESAKHNPCATFARNTAAGRMLDTAFGDVFPHIGSASPSEMTMAIDYLAGLFRLVLQGGEGSEGERAIVAARVRAARSLVSDNLSNPQFNPAWIARLLGVSRATIYRDFAEEGGLERYIYRSRLERGFHLLASSRPERGIVDRVAESVGFSSIHHFSNAFHNHFGLRPTDVCGILSGDDSKFSGANDAHLSAAARDGRMFYNTVRGIAS